MTSLLTSARSSGRPSAADPKHAGGSRLPSGETASKHAAASERVVVSQLGARMHYAVPRILEEAGELERLYTDICAGQGWPRVLRYLPSGALPKALRRLRGRTPAGLPPERVATFPGFGLSFAVRRLTDRTQTQETATLIWGAERLSGLVRSRGFGDATGFYGFSGESLELLRAAREAGLWTVVEQIVAPRDILVRLMEEEEDRFPDWRTDHQYDGNARILSERERAEWAAADLVICGSEFVRHGVSESAPGAAECLVVPYGVDSRFRLPARQPRKGPLRVLTVGAAGLRKGTPYVLAAAEQLRGKADFRLVGPLDLSDAAKTRLARSVELCGAVPRTEILEHFAWADIFLLPSLCEGSATVVYEALAAGLPVVATFNTGTVVRDGCEGFIVPIRDPDAIVAAIESLDSDRALLTQMSGNALARAADFDLANYGRRLHDAITIAARIHSARRPGVAA